MLHSADVMKPIETTQISVSNPGRAPSSVQYARVYAAASFGVNGLLVQVECCSSRNLPNFCLVGLPNAAVRESRDRVLAAFAASGIHLPSRRFTFNLAPAWLPKEGSAYDLAIALSCLAALKIVPESRLSQLVIMGELALNGAILPVDNAGMVPNLIDQHHLDGALVAWDDSHVLREKDLILGGGFTTLAELIAHLNQVGSRGRRKSEHKEIPAKSNLAHIQMVCRNRKAMQFLTVAAAGGHHTLVAGPAGSGKTCSATALPEFLPPLSPFEQSRINNIYRCAGLSPIDTRPFRNPHYSITRRALIGGGPRCAPGEISLADSGVLFLDEFLEFPKAVLEQIRVPLESGSIALARGEMRVELPARFQLIAATNLCPCGRLGSRVLSCRCSRTERNYYQARLSAALLDRFDCHVLLRESGARFHEPNIPFEQIFCRIEKARESSIQRQNCLNRDLKGDTPWEVMAWSEGAKILVERIVRSRKLSLRGRSALGRLSLTQVDLRGGDRVLESDVRRAATLRFPFLG